MNKKVLEFLPRSIAFLLIVGIVVTTFSIINKMDSPVHSIPYTQVGNQTIPPETIEEPPAEIIVEPYYTTYPKQALASTDFIYEQNITGYGDIEIKNLHQTTTNLYSIISTDSKFGDITTLKKSIAIGKFSLLGVIEKLLVLPSRLPLEYINTQITTKGIAVMTKTQDNILVFYADYDLNETETITLPLSNKGRFFNTINGCLILTEGVQNTIYIQNEEMQSGFLPAGEILQIYDFYNYLLVFINTESGYNILKLSSTLKMLQTTVVDGFRAMAITPIAGSEQMFAIVEKGANSTRLWKYNSTFSKQNAIYAELGVAKEINIIPHNDSIMAIFSGNTSGIYMFNSDLECTLSNNTALQDIKKIYDFIPYQNGYYILAHTVSGLCIINYRYDNTHTTLILKEKADCAFLALNLNNTLSAFYNSTDEHDNCFIGIIGTTV